MEYEDFVRSKRRAEVATGHMPNELNEHLFDFQHAIVSWAVRRGRAAIFADTGLGKTLMQLSWADEVASHTGGMVLILAPLAVSEQTIEQGKTFGIEVNRVPHGETPNAPGIWITNYERMDVIDFSELNGIVLDESSILKSHNGKTRTAIIESSQSVPYRLSCTATPSPNDFDELGNQCEFLGVMTRTEMLATYFVNDTGDTGTWRLKGWGQSRFWEWMGTWSVVLRNPSDIGFDGSRYILPEPEYIEHVVETETLSGELFARPAMSMLERRQAQRTKALGLLHKTIRENSTMSRMGLPDYVVTMRKPGDCDERVKHGEDLPVGMWQKYASPIWDDINQGRTLNKLPARDENDEKHMCPLQLDVIERCIHLWTNPDDLVFSPFTGIGSEGYCAVKMGRRFVGTELKPAYYELACLNIEDAKQEQKGLF